jgi:glutamate/tyrosine decarboxylase-like PLP-dependent enzyme
MPDLTFPEDGRSAPDLLAEIEELRGGDLDWRGGRAFSLVYDSDDADLEHLLEEVGRIFLHENALNPFRYETLLKMETEVVGFAVDLFGATCGSMSSGGTESIFLAVQTARDAGRARGITAPKLVCCDTAHPAFAKACHYLGVEQVLTPHREDGRADPLAFASAMDPNTVLVVASTPCYPYGVIDPVTEIAGLASEQGTLCHVDACLGGWLLPWWERLGETVPPWNFAVPGVTSLSADIHKYGYAYKGASVVLYRDRDLYQHQIFMYDSWPGGLYASSSSAGTRPGGPIAGAWAAISHLGADGYMRLAERVRTATRGFQAGIEAIDGLAITHAPDLSLFEFGSVNRSDGSPGPDMDAVCDQMDDRGWNLDRQQGGLHLMVAPGHDKVVEQFCADLAASVAEHGEARGGEHVYGGVV